jgi:hypothetical protein
MSYETLLHIQCSGSADPDPDPEPLVRGMDPDTSIIKQKK